MAGIFSRLAPKAKRSASVAVGKEAGDVASAYERIGACDDLIIILRAASLKGKFLGGNFHREFAHFSLDKSSRRTSQHDVRR